MPSASSTRTIRGVLAIVGGLLIHLTIGAFYTFGNMLPYMATYMADKDSGTKSDYKFYSANGVWIFALQTVSFSTFVVIGAKLELKIGPSLTCLIGCCLNSLGVGLTYFTIHNFYLTIVTYGLLAGAGIGIAYATPMVVGMRWFPDHKGSVSGCVVLGFGLSASIFTMVQTELINPDNEPLHSESGFLGDSELISRIHLVFFQLALCYFVPQMIGCFLLGNPPEFDYGKNKDDKQRLIAKDKHNYETVKDSASLSLGSDTEMCTSLQTGAAQQQTVVTSTSVVVDGIKLIGEDGSGSANDAKDGENVIDTAPGGTKDIFYDDVASILDMVSYRSNKTISERELVSQIMFWNLWVTKFCNTLCVVYLTSQWKDLCNQHLGIRSDQLLAVMGSVSAVFNGVSRLFWSTLLDYSTYAKAMGTLTVTAGIQFILWPLVVYFESMDVIVVCAFILLSGSYFSLSGNFSVLPTQVTNVWGHKNNGVVYGVVYTAQIPAAFISSFAVVVMRDSLGWMWLTWLIATLAFVSTACAMVFKNPNATATATATKSKK